MFAPKCQTISPPILSINQRPRVGRKPHPYRAGYGWTLRCRATFALTVRNGD